MSTDTTVTLFPTHVHVEGKYNKYITQFADFLKSNNVLQMLIIRKGFFKSAEDVTIVAKALESHPSLSRLELCSEQAWGKAGNLLSACPLLAEFHLGWCTTSVSAELAGISEALKKNTTLKKLFIHDSQLGDEAAKLLFESLKVNKTLILLNLDSNFIGDASANAIKEMLIENNQIEEVYLENNKFTVEGMKVIFEGLKANTTLKKLSLDGATLLSQEVVTHIGSILAQKQFNNHPMLNLGENTQYWYSASCILGLEQCKIVSEVILV